MPDDHLPDDHLEDHLEAKLDSASMLAPCLLGIVATLSGCGPMFVVAGLVSAGADV